MVEIEMIICDICYKTIKLQGAIWEGGTVEIYEIAMKQGTLIKDKQIREICHECMEKIRSILNLPGFPWPISEDERDREEEKIDGIVKNVERSISKPESPKIQILSEGVDPEKSVCSEKWPRMCGLGK
jgi:hypothetical protein